MHFRHQFRMHVEFCTCNLWLWPIDLVQFTYFHIDDRQIHHENILEMTFLQRRKTRWSMEFYNFYKYFIKKRIGFFNQIESIFNPFYYYINLFFQHVKFYLKGDEIEKKAKYAKDEMSPFYKDIINRISYMEHIFSFLDLILLCIVSGKWESIRNKVVIEFWVSRNFENKNITKNINNFDKKLVQKFKIIRLNFHY